MNWWRTWSPTAREPGTLQVNSLEAAYPRSLIPLRYSCSVSVKERLGRLHQELAMIDLEQVMSLLYPPHPFPPSGCGGLLCI